MSYTNLLFDGLAWKSLAKFNIVGYVEENRLRGGNTNFNTSQFEF